MENTKKKTSARRKKILKFRRNEEILLTAADKRIEEGDYFTALRFLNSYGEEYAPCVDLFEMQADVYEMLEVNNQALKAWYAFLDACDEESLADVYEGLAVNYMNLGKETQAAYYYNLLLQVDDDISEENKMEIVETFAKPKKNPFRFVYPPEKADYEEFLNEGLKALKEGKFASAREFFDEVAPLSRQYKPARNLTAISYLLEDKVEEALAICKQLIEEDENDVQAYTTYAAVLGQMGKRAEAMKVARKLCEMPTDDTDELYKIATVCCENELHREALEKFTVLEREIVNDRTLLYFKAVSAYKSGEIQLCIDTFERLLTVYPEASVARYYYDVVRYYMDNREKEDIQQPDLSYFYTVPQQVREQYGELLCFLKKIRKDAAESVGDDRQVRTVLNWCFDESDGSEIDLQNMAVAVAIHCGSEKFVRQVLLNPEVSDLVKLFALEKIAERNRFDEYGVVICHIYRKVKFMRVNLGQKKHRRFMQAFAAVYAKFAIISVNHAKRVCAATELLYHCMLRMETMYLADRPGDVALAVYLLSGIKEGGGTAQSAAKIFEADVDNAEFMVHLVKKVTDDIRKGGAPKGEGEEE